MAFKIMDTRTPTSVKNVISEELTFPVGGAGTVIVMRIQSRPIFNESGTGIGSYEDTSFTFEDGNILTNHVEYPSRKVNLMEFVEDNFTNGDYTLDHLNGILIGKKATSDTSDKCDYITEKINTDGSGDGSGSFDGDVDIKKIKGTTVSVNSGDVNNGTLRVTIADDDTNLSSIKTNISDIKDIFEGGIPSGSSKVMPTVLEEVRGEEHTFEEGEAGTSVIFKFNNRPILNSAGNDVGKFGDSSFRWKQKSIFSDEVPFDTSIYEDIDTKLPIFISTLNEGEYAIDYSNGVFIGVKATSGTSDTCSYEIEKLNVVGSGGDGGGGEVNLTEIDGNTVSTGSGDSGKGTLRVVIANDDLNLSSINTKLNDVIKVEGKVYLGDNVVLPTAPITIPVDYVNERILQFSSAGRIDVAEPNKVYEIPTPPAINDGTTRSMMFEMVIGVSDISDPATGGDPSEPVFPIVKIYRENTLSGEEPTTTEIDTEIFVAPSVVLLPLVHTWSSDKYMLSSNMTAKFYYRIRGAYYLPK